MKKIVPLIAASALIICTLPSCSAGKSIVGKWEMHDLAESGIKVGGIEFKADGKKIQVGEGDQSFTFDEEYITYDKTNLKIEINGQDMLTLARSGSGGSDDNYNGEYELKSGVLYDTIVSGITDNAGGNADDVNVYITFDGSSSEVKFVDIFNYTTKKGKLEISGYASFIGDNATGEAVSADFEIKGDTLKITSDGGNTEELVRVK